MIMPRIASTAKRRRIMALPRMKVYDLHCQSCDWNDVRLKRATTWGILNIFTRRFPKRCPECKGKITVKRNYTIRM
jgi:hypothetical protein